jgi:hypothetical protein
MRQSFRVEIDLIKTERVEKGVSMLHSQKKSFEEESLHKRVRK